MALIKKRVTLFLAFLLVLVGVPFQVPLYAAVNDYMTVSKSVNPATITTEEEAEVTLSIKGTPPVNVVEPNDVILIIDKSGSMRPEYNNGEDKMAAAKQAAKGFIDLMDFTKHRVGIVDFSSTTLTRTFPLTNDAAAAKAYIDTITANGSTATGYAIDQAIAELANHRPEARPVIVIMTDGDATEPQGNAYEYAKERAQAAKDQGIIFYTIALLKSTDNPDTSGPNLLLKEMATTADHHHFVLGSQGLQEIYAAIVKEIGMASAYDVTVKDVVSPNFEIVPGSYDNNIPKPQVNGNTLMWKFNELKNNTLTFTYKIKPKDPDKTGSMPVSTIDSIVTYKDYAGAIRSKAIPSVNLQVKYPAPVITSIENDYGHPNGGETVTIRGDKFRTGATVKFGYSNATNVQVINANEITAVTPAGAQGTVTVTVTNPDGQKATTTYQYKANPVVTSIEPNNGPLAGGTLVFFKGNYFMNGITVKFGDKVAPMNTYTSATYFKVNAPAGDTPGPVDVVLTNPDGTTVTIPGGYTYNAPPVDELSVTSITPNTGELAGGEAIYIDGKKFDSNIKVYFADKEAPLISYYSDTRIKVQAPAGSAAGPVDVTVVNPDGKSATVTGGYTYKPAPELPAPTITSLSPISGPIAGGTLVYIDGTNFVQGVKVYFGDKEAVTTTFATSSRVKATTPSVTAAGPVDVKVVNPDGKEAVSAQAFTYLAPPPPDKPTIKNINPNSGPTAGGTVVYIDGTNFVNGLKVYFGNNEAQVITFYSGTRIKVSAPANAADGAVDVKIVNPDGQEAVQTAGFTYVAPPPEPVEITKITPNTGYTIGGEIITIDGVNFKQGATVQFGSIPVPLDSFLSNSRVKVKAPASNGYVGPVDVTITNPDGQTYTYPQGYTYVEIVPEITNVNPNHGPMAGGTVVYVDGKNFDPNMTLTVDGKPVPITTYYSSSRFKFTTPSSTTSGQVPIVVTLPNGQSATGTFTYDAPPPSPAPVITKINPTYGPVAGGTIIYVDGTGFQNGLKVYFDGVEGTLVTYYSNIRLKIKSPAASNPGTAQIKIINPDGQESNTIPFEYK